MRESGLWSTIKRNLDCGSPALHMTRIENSAGDGTPDVELCYLGRCAWVELKHLEAFPVRPGTVVKITHYTDEQRLWLKQRGGAGGRAWLFIQVGKEYYIFDWEEAQKVGVSMTAADWKFRCYQRWVGRFDWSEWLEIVTTR